MTMRSGIIDPVRTPVDLGGLRDPASAHSGDYLWGCLALDHELQRLCRTMHRVGMLVNQEERQRLMIHYSTRANEQAARCRAFADDPSLNLNSPQQVGALLYGKAGWDLEPVEFTETGQPSTADAAIRALLRDPFLSEGVRSFLLAYRRAKKADKMVSTFLRPAAPVLAGGASARLEAAKAAAALALGYIAKARSALPLAGASSFLRSLEAATLTGDKPIVTMDDRRAIRRALHDVWGLTPIKTANGGVTVARDALVQHWRESRSICPAGHMFLQALLDAWSAAEEAARLFANPEDEEEDRCILDPFTGRVHPDWRADRVVSGRLASSPNLQNVVRRLRSMYVPGANRLYAYADMDQLELRVADSRWSAMSGIRGRYLDAFDTFKVGADGETRWMDPHQMSMHAIYGDDIWELPGAPPPEWRLYKGWPGGGIEGEFDARRDLVKRVVYLGIYMGEALTAHEVITGAEDDDGNLLYQDLTVTEVAAMLEGWRDGCPEIVKGWEIELQQAKDLGYVQCPVSGRKSWWREDATENDKVNRPIQTIGASLVALATLEFAEKWPEDCDGPHTGLSNLCHDALLAEVASSNAPRAAADMQEAMTRAHPALPGVRFIAKGVVKKAWEEKKEKKRKAA